MTTTVEVTRTTESGERKPSRSLWGDAWYRLRKNRMAMVSLWTLAAMGLLAVLTPLLPLAPPRRVDMDRAFAPPCVSPLFEKSFPLPGAESQEGDAGDEVAVDPIAEGFGRLDPFSGMLLSIRLRLFGAWSLSPVCGTDKLGRDVLSRVMWGGRISIAVGIVATLVSLVIGVTYGAISGFLGGWIDNVMMRLVDILYSIPFIFVVIFLITILSAEPIKNTLETEYGINRVVVFFFVVGAIYWLTMARVVRGQVIVLKNELFVEAARAIGAGTPRIIFRHIVPNLMSVVIVYLTLTIPRVMLFEAFLSFLGLGVEPPDVSWGLLANEGLQAITPVRIYWWLVAFPSLALAVTLFALNFLGDGLRDALDPRLKNL
ncbi:MAG: ABC transporter permease [Planctomycetota bacterium]|nr:MAG: ABC transporter permease [Planctomycetota bacterium]